MKHPTFLGLLIGAISLFLTRETPSFSSDEKMDPTFIVKSAETTLVYRRSDLLSRKDLVQINVEEDPAYSGKKTSYSAVPLHSLFQSISVEKDALLQFNCLDGFSAAISKDRVLNQTPDKSIAYLAIEPKNEKWPDMNPTLNKGSPGPFYLIWLNPKLSKIGREEWPFQLAGFEVKKPLHVAYPALLPDSHLSSDHLVNRGFKVFMKNCFTCHTLNLQGESSMGPDLNVPMNPTEYLTPKALKSLVRDPQNLRYWPSSKMKGFSKKELADSELNELVGYLKHMAKRKVKGHAKKN